MITYEDINEHAKKYRTFKKERFISWMLEYGDWDGEKFLKYRNVKEANSWRKKSAQLTRLIKRWDEVDQMKNNDHRIEEVYCCNCKKKVCAELIGGAEAYPNCVIPRVKKKKFWKCPKCKGFVGSHGEERNFKPLGSIPTPALKDLRKMIHVEMDSLWKKGGMKRNQVYKEIGKRLNTKEYHTAEIRSIKEGAKVLKIIRQIKNENNKTRKT